MKEIPLSQGKVALVDDCDYDYLMQWKWYATKGEVTWYAKRSVHNKLTQKKDTVCMHRLILGVENPKLYVDHKDHDGLNNTRSNIRVCTPSQNNLNRKKSVGRSKYKGVFFVPIDTRIKKWRASIDVNGRRFRLGAFKTEEDAARAYDAKAVELQGEFAYLNFPKQIAA